MAPVRSTWRLLCTIYIIKSIKLSDSEGKIECSYKKTNNKKTAPSFDEKTQLKRHIYVGIEIHP